MGEETQIVIPATYNNLPVTAIQGQYATGAFARSQVTTVYIPDSVRVIGQNSFSNCSNLKSVIISASSNLSEIGNNAFSGCSLLESFYLPKGAVRLKNSVFNNCGSLKEFIVDQENSAYRSENGHLIEKSTNILIRGGHNRQIPESVTSVAQAAFRRTNGITRLYIPLSVTSIGNYFIADSTIAEIAYQGNMEQWNLIEKDESMWNYGNREVLIEYSANFSQRYLIAYFSNTGNTERVARIIAEKTSGTLWEIVPETPYTSSDLNYSNNNCRARQEYDNANSRPLIASAAIDMQTYDAVFIGYPIWYSLQPRIIQTFLESYDLSKTPVYIFSTSASSSGNRAYSELCSLYTDVNFSGNIHFTSSTLNTSETLIEEWLSELQII